MVQVTKFTKNARTDRIMSSNKQNVDDASRKAFSAELIYFNLISRDPDFNPPATKRC